MQRVAHLLNANELSLALGANHNKCVELENGWCWDRDRPTIYSLLLLHRVFVHAFANSQPGDNQFVVVYACPPESSTRDHVCENSVIRFNRTGGVDSLL